MSDGFSEDERRSIQAEYRAVVNMTPSALAKWLESEESRSVGMTSGGEKVTKAGGSEAVGHHMGERIVAIGHKKQADLDDDDFADMRKVVGYIHRHSKQRPSGDVSETRWRYSLMNWGHDPLKDK